MAAHGWRSHRPLNVQVLQEYGDFDYYQLVRLSRWMVGRGAPVDDHEPENTDELPKPVAWETLADNRRPWDESEERRADQRLRMHAELSSGFGGGEVSGLRLTRASNDGQGDGGDAGIDQITFANANYCLDGTNGCLPAPYSEWAWELRRDGEHAMADFLDLFNNRIHLWRWRLKSSLHPGLDNQHPDRGDYAAYLASLIGLLDPDLVEHLPVPRRTLLGLAGLLLDNRRSGPAITQTLETLLGAEVKLDPLQGRWLNIDAPQTNRLGGANSRLGEDCLLGRQWFNPQAGIGIRVAPLPYERICPLLPGGKHHAMLRDLLRLLTERRMDVFVTLQVEGERPALRLGGSADGCGARLQYTSVLPGETPDEPHRIEFLVPAFDEGAAA